MREDQGRPDLCGGTVPEPNALLRAARERARSRERPGARMSRDELADLVVQWLTARDDNNTGLLLLTVATWARSNAARSAASNTMSPRCALS